MYAAWAYIYKHRAIAALILGAAFGPGWVWNALSQRTAERGADLDTLTTMNETRKAMNDRMTEAFRLRTLQDDLRDCNPGGGRPGISNRELEAGYRVEALIDDLTQLEKRLAEIERREPKSFAFIERRPPTPTTPPIIESITATNPDGGPPPVITILPPGPPEPPPPCPP
jgi:hypothetical protein